MFLHSCQDETGELELLLELKRVGSESQGSCGSFFYMRAFLLDGTLQFTQLLYFWSVATLQE